MKKLMPLFSMMMFVFLLSCKSGDKQSELTIPFEKYTLPNGLTVILHEDKSDPIAAWR
jgi:zinc protease